MEGLEEGSEPNDSEGLEACASLLSRLVWLCGSSVEVASKSELLETGLSDDGPICEPVGTIWD